MCLIGGSGDCFFQSISSLLKHVPKAIASELQHSDFWDVDPTLLRLQVVSWLRECAAGQHGILGERCVLDMEEELGRELVTSGRQCAKKPESIDEYLDASANVGVWVQGYHWLRAVSHIFNVCVGVIIHNHEHMYLFGDQKQQRIYLYKRDTDTHYDALEPCDPCDPVPKPVSSSHAVEPDAIPYRHILRVDGKRFLLTGSFPHDSTLETLASHIVRLGYAEAGSFSITFPKTVTHPARTYDPCAFGMSLHSCAFFSGQSTLTLQRIDRPRVAASESSFVPTGSAAEVVYTTSAAAASESSFVPAGSAAEVVYTTSATTSAAAASESSFVPAVSKTSASVEASSALRHSHECLPGNNTYSPSDRQIAEVSGLC
jgi:hypothetical protein